MKNTDKKTLRDKLIAVARFVVKWTREANPRAKLPRYIAVSRLWSGRNFIKPIASPTFKLWKWEKYGERTPDLAATWETQYDARGVGVGLPMPPLMSIVYDTVTGRCTDEWVTGEWSKLDAVPGIAAFAWDEIKSRLPWAP